MKVENYNKYKKQRNNSVFNRAPLIKTNMNSSEINCKIYRPYEENSSDDDKTNNICNKHEYNMKKYIHLLIFSKDFILSIKLI